MKTRFLIVISSVIAGILSLTSCNSSESKEKISETTVIAEKDKYEETPMGLFFKTFFEQNPDMFNNAILEEQKVHEMEKQFGEKVESGILNDMVFTCLSVEKDVVTEKLKAVFYASVIQKDSIYSATAFINSYVSDSLVTKLKEQEGYKLLGKITFEKSENAGPKVHVEKEVRKIDKKFVDRPNISVHGLNIDLKDVIHMNQ